MHKQLGKKKKKNLDLLKKDKIKLHLGTYWLEYQRCQNSSLIAISSTRYIRSHISSDKKAHQFAIKSSVSHVLVLAINRIKVFL